MNMYMFTYLHVIRLYWKWHTYIPYALEYPRTIGVSAWDESRENGSEGCLKKIKNINRRSGPIDIHRRVVHKQIKNINRRSCPIDIYQRVVHKQIIYQSSEWPN